MEKSLHLAPDVIAPGAVRRNAYALLALTLAGGSLAASLGSAYPVASLTNSLAGFTLTFWCLTAILVSKQAWHTGFLFLFTAVVGFSSGDLLRHAGVQEGPLMAALGMALSAAGLLGLSAWSAIKPGGRSNLTDTLALGGLSIALGLGLCAAFGLALSLALGAVGIAAAIGAFVVVSTSREIKEGAATGQEAAKYVYLDLLTRPLKKIL